MARLTTLEQQSRLRSSLVGSLGTFIGIPAKTPYELASLAGIGWVVSDLEHGENEFAQLSDAVKGFLGPVICRVPSLSTSDISRALDRGVAGVMLPRVANSESLDQALAATMYPPRGNRGVASYNRSAAWGEDANYLLESNPVVMVQVETVWAVANCAEILASDLVDAIFIGPLDLSFALGIPRDYESADFQRAISVVVESCKRAGKPVGILANSTEQAKKYRAAGFDFVAIGSDSTLLLGAFKQVIAEIEG